MFCAFVAAKKVRLAYFFYRVNMHKFKEAMAVFVLKGSSIRFLVYSQ